MGVAKTPTTIDVALLEHCLRENLNRRALRVMAVLRPLKVVIENYPDGRVEETSAGFSRDDLNAISRLLAAHLGRPVVTVAEANDGQPSFRPG